VPFTLSVLPYFFVVCVFVTHSERAIIDRLLAVAKIGVLLVVFAAVYNLVMAATGLLPILAEISVQRTPL